MTTTFLFSSSIQINTATAFSKNIVAEAKASKFELWA